MNPIIIIGNLVIFGLAVWKVWDLCFGKSQHQTLQKPTSDFGNPNIVTSWTQQFHLVKFFAEFTYKTMKNNKEYQPAPKELYDWLFREFLEWIKQQNKT